MAGLRQIARENATELRDGIAWVVVWKTGRSWHAHPFWLDDADCFEPDDMPLIEQILEKDENAVMLNGYYCGHFGEDMNADELAAGIDWHYSRGANLLKNSGAIPEPVPEPDPEPDPYVYTGEMSPEEYEEMHRCIDAENALKAKLSELLPGMDEETAAEVASACARLGCTTESMTTAVEALKTVVQQAVTTFSQLWDALRETIEKIRDAIAPMPELADPDFIQAATDNPRQAHLCYHGRKARTRKKNRHILERKAERIRRIRKRGENMSKPYIVCPDCDSNLDPGERCDCSARYHAEEKEDDTDADSDIEQAPRGLRPAASA